MPKPETQPRQEPRRAATPWLVAAIVVAALLGVGLYGVRAGWFESEEEFAPNFPQRRDEPGRPPAKPNDAAVARASWDAPEGATVVGVGSAGGPSEATLAVRDNRADVVIRVPRARSDGTPFAAYSVDVRSGQSRLWGTRLPVAEASGKAEALSISFNAELLRSMGVAAEPIKVTVGGSVQGKGEALGIVQLTLPQTP